MNTRTVSSPEKWLTESSLENESGRIFVKSVCGFGNLTTLYRETDSEEKQSWESAFSSGPLIYSPYKYTPEEVAYFLGGNAAVYETGIDNSGGNILCNLVTSSLNKTPIDSPTQATAYFKNDLSYMVCVMLSRLAIFLETSPLGSCTLELYSINDQDEESLMNWTTSTLSPSFSGGVLFWRTQGQQNAATLQYGYDRYIHIYTAGFSELDSDTVAMRLKITYIPPVN